MIKKLLLFAFTITFLLTGCSNNTEQPLAFRDRNYISDNNSSSHLSESSFFAAKLAVIPKDQAVGADSQLSASASLLVDMNQKNFLYADQIYDKLYPASLTKLMTALVALENGELTDTVTISHEASHISEPGAKLCGFKEGDTMTLEALLNCLLIYSGNDAGIAIAEYISSSVEAFVKKMNETAKEIGAVQTNFVNPHGLHDENHYTSAYDIYLIFHRLLQYDTFRSIIQNSSYKLSYSDVNGNPKEKTFTSTNQYFTGKKTPVEGLFIEGGKTGTTSKAGYCLILLCKDQAGNEYIAQILNAADNNELYSQMNHLLSYIK